MHDRFQELKLHPLLRRILEGGKRVAGREDDPPKAGFNLPRKLHFPGGMIVGDAAGFVNIPALKGIHYAIRSGMLAAETAVAAAGLRDLLDPGRARGLRPVDPDSFIWKDLQRVRNMRPAFARGFVVGSALAGAATASFGRFPPGNLAVHADADAPVGDVRRSAAEARQHDALTFDKLSSVYLREQ